MKRLSLAVYVMALSLMLVLLMVGYVIQEGRQHQADLAQAVREREEAVNLSLIHI